MNDLSNIGLISEITRKNFEDFKNHKVKASEIRNGRIIYQLTINGVQSERPFRSKCNGYESRKNCEMTTRLNHKQFLQNGESAGNPERET